MRWRDALRYWKRSHRELADGLSLGFIFAFYRRNEPVTVTAHHLEVAWVRSIVVEREPQHLGALGNGFGSCDPAAPDPCHELILGHDDWCRLDEHDQHLVGELAEMERQPRACDPPQSDVKRQIGKSISHYLGRWLHCPTIPRGGDRPRGRSGTPNLRVSSG